MDKFSELIELQNRSICRLLNRLPGTVSNRLNRDLEQITWRRQRGHGKTKDLIGRTVAQHVRYKTLYIS